MEITKPDGKKIRTPAESIQSIYSKPGFDSDCNLKYSDEDKGPFSVYVSKIEPDPASRYALKILKFLHKNNITGIKEGGIKKLGRNKISVDFISAEKANKFLDLDILECNKYFTYIPKFQIFLMRVVRDIPTDWSLEELI
ncbi:unnamed protein product [Leptidea sinapis]|uniref:Uncharacterized protein n=1 Tax=Leptidea sinapis TaxID=189913 RepID=A0A5E4PQC5_9NEOP|nr:unnamed protein product [Leptidea sinapis]